jgi:L-asparagine oxygenase
MKTSNIQNSIIKLTTKEIEQMVHLSKQIEIHPSTDSEIFCQKAKECSKYIPKRIQTYLSQISQYGYLIFQTFPDDFFENTPNQNTEQIGGKTQLAKIQSILLSFIGEMISYEAEGNGYLLQDIVPVKNMSNLQTSVGSNIELEIHTEQAFSNLRPDFLSLACLRGDENAFTYILPVSHIIQTNMDSILQKLLWKTQVDLSFKLNGTEFVEGDIRGPLAILNGSLEDPHLIFDQDLMTGITKEADKKIEDIIEIYKNNRISHCLQPGEILILDNRKVVHGRSPFSPKYDSKDRFLIRGFAVVDYEKSEYARKQRMVLAKYS